MLLAKTADPEIMRIYERLLNNKKDRVVVPIENRTCSGCHIALTAQHENVVRKGERLIFCEHCSRIHYWQESEADRRHRSRRRRRRRRRKLAGCPRRHLNFSFREGKLSLHFIERKVWTSQERIPVNGWAPQGDGKCNRNHPVFCKEEQDEKSGFMSRSHSRQLGAL